MEVFVQENGRGNIRIECESAALVDYRELTELQGNFKKRTAKDVELMSRSILKYGFSFPFFVWRSAGAMYCLDGHGRLTALRALEAEGYEIPEVPVAWIEAVDEQEAKQKLLRMNSNYDEITMEGVLEFTADMDVEWDEIVLSGSPLEMGDQNESEEEQYTRKVETPIYTPTQDIPPTLDEMIDADRRNELLEEITKAKLAGLLTNEAELLLREAAQRHVVFDYSQVAEYYAHAPADVQRLMERSALVIIDIESAIENGFVKLTKQLQDLYAEEAANDA